MEYDLSDPIRSFVDTVRRVIFSTRDLFRGMPRGENVLNPLIFAAVCVLIGAVMSGVFQEVTQALVAQTLLAAKCVSGASGELQSVLPRSASVGRHQLVWKTLQ